MNVTRARPTDRALQGATCAGTTLLELLVVMVIISVLLGIGVGVFGRFTLVNAADNAGAGIRAMVRVIRDYARNRGTVGTVALDMKGNRVNGLMERVVGQWHFEDEGGTTTGAFGYDPTIGGGSTLVKDGCIGGALTLDGTAAAGAELGRSGTFNSEYGVSVFCDLWLDDDNKGGVIVSQGDAYGLRVEGDGSLVGWVGVYDDSPTERLDVLEVHSGGQLVPTSKWARVGLYYDRVQIRIFIDYREVGAAQEMRPLGRDLKRALSVGGAAGSVKGKIDGLRLGALGPGDGGDLPPDVTLKGGTGVIRFNPDGHLDPRYHLVPARIVLEGGDGGTRTVVIGLMGDVSLE